MKIGAALGASVTSTCGGEVAALVGDSNGTLVGIKVGLSEGSIDVGFEEGGDEGYLVGT